MKSKHYVYACVGLRPSERQEVVRLLTELGPEASHLRQANPREIPDFWIVNGDEPASLDHVQREGAVHVLEVSSQGRHGGVYCLRRPFEVVQSNQVLKQFWGTMPEPLAHKIAKDTDFHPQLASGALGWQVNDSDEGSRFVTQDGSPLDTEAVELTPSELAMTEDDPDELARLRQAAVDRLAYETLEPFTDGMDMSQEWLDVLPAQILVLTELGDRAKTLPKGLRKMGFGVDVIDGFDAALLRVRSSDYKVIFLDQDAAGRMLLNWCRTLLNTRNGQGEIAKVVVLGRRKTPWDRWRALRAGCAAWMPVPLDRRTLLDLLTQHGVERSLPRTF